MDMFSSNLLVILYFLPFKTTLQVLLYAIGFFRYKTYVSPYRDTMLVGCSKSLKTTLSWKRKALTATTKNRTISATKYVTLQKISNNIERLPIPQRVQRRPKAKLYTLWLQLVY